MEHRRPLVATVEALELHRDALAAQQLDVGGLPQEGPTRVPTRSQRPNPSSVSVARPLRYLPPRLPRRRALELQVPFRVQPLSTDCNPAPQRPGIRTDLGLEGVQEDGSSSMQELETGVNLDD